MTVAAGNSQNAYRSADGGATWTAATGLVNETTNASAPQGVAIGLPGSGTTVYLSILCKAEATAFEVIADGVAIYNFREKTLVAASDNVLCSFRLPSLSIT